MNKVKYLLIPLVFFIAITLPLSSHAQATCGNIITEYDYGDGPVDELTPIANCANPFNADSPEPFTYELTLSGQAVAKDSLVTVKESENVIGSFSISKPGNYYFDPLEIYKQEGDDYRLINYINNNNFEIAPLVPGNYVAVFVWEETPIMEVKANSNWLDFIKKIFLPATALAFYGDYQDVVAIPFTIEYTTPEPLVASSVLFLPGIQASRLYKGSLLGEDEVWPPNALFDNDVNALAMDENGVSENEIYTRDIIDTSFGVGDVYAGLQRFLDNLETDEVIDDWSPYAYDWRYNVTDIVENGTRYKDDSLDEIRNAITEIERLAATSYSGRVSIIGHSNGGLLAKAIMQQLESEGKANLIDKIILLASPQLGTPKAIGTILHGYDQADPLGGIIISQEGVRKVIQNLPGAYGLLPSEKYFEGLNESLVTFTNDIVTEPYREVYGTSLSNFADVTSFLKGIDSLDRDINNPGSTPSRANSVMLDDALTTHESLDDWVAPDGIKVIEIVGTGLVTMKAIEYRGIIEDKCLTAGPAGIICTPETELKPYANLTHYGDGTVMQRSAEGYEGVKEKYFVNLEAIENSGFDTSYLHHNITEAPPVQDLLASILMSTTTEENQFISTTHTEFNNEYEVEIIDSPVRLLATDEDGNQTGVVLVNDKKIIKQEIPGSQYFEFGGTKYFVVPKGINRTTKLYGEDYGGYTLTIATLGSTDVQTIETTLQNATVTPNLIAEYSNINSTFSTIITDSNGDGISDYETTLDGVLIEEVIITYPILISAIDGLTLSKARKQALLFIIKKAEYFSYKTPSKHLYRALEDTLLKSAQELVKLYVKKRYMTESDAAEIQEMIKVLKDKQ